MESQLLSAAIRTLSSEGVNNLSFLNNPEERTVNLTNSSVNIENSRDVRIGNAIYHYYAPVTIQQITTETEELEQEDASQLCSAEPEQNPVGIQSISIRKKYNLLNVTIFISISLLVIISILYLWISTSDDIPIHHFDIEKIRPDFLEKPSYSFGNKSKLGPCKIIEEEDWGIKRNLDDIKLIHPIPLVIFSHSETPFCENYLNCTARVAQMQQYHISLGSPDIAYNFIIGGDGNIYVGRGWKARNSHWGNHSVGLNFVGNYYRDELTPKMIECAKSILKYGEDNDFFTKDYIVVCHNQTSIKGRTTSPGPNVCGEIKTWPHYSAQILTWNFLYHV